MQAYSGTGVRLHHFSKWMQKQGDEGARKRGEPKSPYLLLSIFPCLCKRGGSWARLWVLTWEQPTAWWRFWKAVSRWSSRRRKAVACCRQSWHLPRTASDWSVRRPNG